MMAIRDGEYNTERKAAGSRPVGIDHLLSREHVAVKQQLRGQWQEARKLRKRRAPKTFWQGAWLFVEGKVILPLAATSVARLRPLSGDGIPPDL